MTTFGSSTMTKKFVSLVHYVCYKADKNHFSTMKLNKILWLSDMFWFFQHGESITGEKYIKRQFGPVPAHIFNAIEKLKNENKLTMILKKP